MRPKNFELIPSPEDFAQHIVRHQEKYLAAIITEFIVEEMNRTDFNPQKESNDSS